jgi:Holliday junction resolvase-like predicted endonuclease
MGKMQRRKGANGEREVAHLFQAAGLVARRGLRQWQDRHGEPDVVVQDLSWLWVEVKRGKRTNVKAALEQAKEACLGKERIPVAICRDDQDEHTVTMRLPHFLSFLTKAFPDAVKQLDLFDGKKEGPGTEDSNPVGNPSGGTAETG